MILSHPLLDDLNSEQQEAVSIAGGPVMVVAGAGSGKTRVLTHRIAYLIQEMGVRPDAILAITFTNKAAREMRDRVGELLGATVNNMWVSTFHSACARILRREAHVFGYRSNFSIYDRSDSVRLVKHCLNDLGLDASRLSPRGLLNKISGAKNDLVDYETFLDRAEGPMEVAEVYKLYQQRLLQMSAMDFDDLLMVTVELFGAVPEVLAKYQDIFRHVLVDEYQDTNRAQYLLVRDLARKHRSLFVVGDSDQSIYAFRGADYRNFDRFDDDFPESRRVTLNRNYRSTSTILDAANEVISANLRADPKDLWCDQGEGERITVHQGHGSVREAQFVARRAKKLVAQGYNPADMAVFYRTNAQSRAFEEALRRAKLPYQVVGAVAFYQRREVKDVVAYLQVVSNPDDGVALRRIINTPRRGIGRTSLGHIERYVSDQEVSLREALEVADDIPGISTRARKGVKELADVLGRIRGHLESEGVGRAAESAIFDTRIAEMATAAGGIEAEARSDNLAELSRVAYEFESSLEADLPPMERLGRFLEGASLVSDPDNLDEGAGAVALMTVHSAKGLEFSVVFVVGMQDGLFPHERSISDPDELEEERRLFYVAITRSMERLHLSWDDTRMVGGYPYPQVPSRFLREIPDRLVEKGGGPAFQSGGNASTASAGLATSGGAVRPFRGIVRQSGFEVGDRVRHPDWGLGRVLTISGRGMRASATVFFPDLKERRELMLSVVERVSGFGP
ncbi:MAG: UvrD-helicase domain-containing protein [Actinomycetia bacterium]|nr:UvrD-helicase domain-containing protein [Actinomycetes bacterium]